ncbi:hypothetical protein BH09ACT1_BH09ACT1_07140 [soil metagenome]
MSAAVIRDINLPLVASSLDELRTSLGKQANWYLTWKNIRTHSHRLHIASSLAGRTWLKVVAVVACKHHLPPGALNESQIYLYQLRFLLERLSWLGRQHRQVVSYTLAHIVRFKLAELRHYEEQLRGMNTEIDWVWLDPKGGSIDQPQRVQELQLADLAVSAIGTAFNADHFGNVETRYLTTLNPRFYRPNARSAVTSYGLKMHPWNETTKAAYPWIAAL